MISKGQTSRQALRGLERKAFHQGQFFTPVEIASRMQFLLGVDSTENLSILDSSAGCGRLIEGLRKHRCTAIEIDRTAVDALEALKLDQPLSVFHGDFLDYDALGFDVAILNPPFNLDLIHKRIREFGFGRYSPLGELTKANSVYVSLAHALQAASVVACIIPHGYLSDTRDDPECKAFLSKYGARVQAILTLPAGAFEAEGTQVNTQCALFLPHQRKGRVREGDFNDDVLGYDFRERALECLSESRSNRAVIRKRGLPRNIAGLPEHGANALRLTRKGRNLVIQPDSLDTYWRALETICGHANEVRYHSFKYGDRPRAFGMDLNAYLIQPNPTAEFSAMVEELVDNGLKVSVDSGMTNWLAKEARRLVTQRMPMRRWASVDGHQSKLCWLHTHPRATGFLHSPDRELPLEVGDRVTLVQESPTKITLSDERGRRFPYTRLMAACYLELDGAPSLNESDYGRSKWREVYPGVEHYQPATASALKRRAEALGLTTWLRRFALQDVIEITARGSGLYNADMGLAKTRFGLAAALLSGVKHALFCIKSRHLSEWLAEMKKIGLTPKDFNIIDSPQRAHELGRFNLITYTRLHQVAVRTRKNRNTYADLLRGRIGLIVGDEAQLLSNPTSKRSMAFNKVRARRVVLMTGTAMRGYARHVYNLLRIVGGDSTPTQPFGLGSRAHLHAGLLHSAYNVRSGTQAFFEEFIDTRSASDQFLATMSEGYRQGERPRVKKVHSFREYISPLLLRRSKFEPEVAAEVQLPIARIETMTITPSHAHLMHYYKYAGRFVKWLEDELKATGAVRDYRALKHHLADLHWASSFPSHQQFTGFTEVQKAILRDAASDVPPTDKAILTYDNPSQVEFMAKLLAERGLSVVFMHGRMSIQEREVILYDLFRDGTAQWLVTSTECINECYNLAEVNWIFFGDCAWEPSVYDQVSARMLRPSQSKQCTVRHYLADGMLPSYRHAFAMEKAKAIVEAIDFDHVADSEIPSLSDLLKQLAWQFGKAA